MAQDKKLNLILKEMWRIDEVRNTGAKLSQEDHLFYLNNLPIITDYYTKNSIHWLVRAKNYK